MTKTILDADFGFSPSDDERPAGEWMEGYWAEIALWANRFAFVIWAYFGCMAYVEFMANKAILIVFYTPVAMLGYFCFRFGQDLERASVVQDQLLLETAFRQLQRFLILGLVIASLWMLVSAAQWYGTFQIMTEYNSPHKPLLSE